MDHENGNSSPLSDDAECDSPTRNLHESVFREWWNTAAAYNRQNRYQQRGQELLCMSHCTLLFVLFVGWNLTIELSGSYREQQQFTHISNLW